MATNISINIDAQGNISGGSLTVNRLPVDVTWTVVAQGAINSITITPDPVNPNIFSNLVNKGGVWSATVLAPGVYDIGDGVNGKGKAPRISLVSEDEAVKY